MKKNRIIAGLSALVMGATMMAGTAMSASAADVYDLNDNYVGDGGFYTIWEDTNNDGVVDENDDYTPAPTKYGINMYDGMISSIVDNADGTYTLTLTSVSSWPVSGSISSITAVGSSNNLINNNIVTLDADTDYVATINATLFSIPVHTEVKTIQYSMV